MSDVEVLKLIREGRKSLEFWENSARSMVPNETALKASKGTFLGTAEAIVSYYKLEGGLEILDTIRADFAKAETVLAARTDQTRLPAEALNIPELNAGWEKIIELTTERDSFV